MIPLFCLFAGAGLAYCVNRVVTERYEERITTNAILLLLLFQGALAIAVLLVIDRFLLIAMAVAWIPSSYELSKALGNYCANKTVFSLFFPSIFQPAKMKLGRMKKLLQEEDLAGAMAVCLETFEAHPKEVDILLDGAVLLGDRGHCEEALQLYQRAMDAASEGSESWAQAAWRAAALCEERLGDMVRAQALYRRLTKKAPMSAPGRLAGARLQRLASNALSQEADPFHRGKTAPPE